MFTDMVNVTDEALVMQVVKFYFPRWDKGEDVLEEEGSQDSNDVGSKQSCGAEKGERLTCSRTARTFYDYCRKVKAARDSDFTVLWDTKLQSEAIQKDREDMDEKERNRRDEDFGKENSAGNEAAVFDADLINGCFGGAYGVEELPSAATQV